MSSVQTGDRKKASRRHVVLHASNQAKPTDHGRSHTTTAAAAIQSKPVLHLGPLQRIVRRASLARGKGGSTCTAGLRHTWQRHTRDAQPGTSKEQTHATLQPGSLPAVPCRSHSKAHRAEGAVHERQRRKPPAGMQQRGWVATLCLAPAPGHLTSQVTDFQLSLCQRYTSSTMPRWSVQRVYFTEHAHSNTHLFCCACISMYDECVLA